MIRKTRSKIRAAIKKFLGLDSLEESIDTLNTDLIVFKRHVNSELASHNATLKRNSKDILENLNKINVLQNTISNVVSVGSDIEVYGRGNSWAVVCIEGKYNVVKFFDLSHQDGREMLKLLKAFEGGRHVYDSPIGFFPKDYFVDWHD